jgi:DNA-binding response OmpR family regulator
MKISHTNTKVLLIGRHIRHIDRMIETLNLVGAELFFADDAAEGLHLMSLEPPDFVVCDIDLPDTEAADLCSAIRSSFTLKRVPVLFAGDTSNGVAGIFKALNAGADDFITQHFDPNAFLAKVVWIMEQRSDETARRERYESLRRSQMQTLEIVRETAEMFQSLELDGSVEVPMQTDERVEMGLRMIAGLTNLIEEQIRASDGWFGTRDEEEIVTGANRKPFRGSLTGRELSLAA